MLLLNYLFIVFWLEEIPLPSRLYESLPLIILSLHLARPRLYQYINRNHHWLIPHEADREICKPRHKTMSSHCPETLA
jgi:hypothetical protein